MDNLNKFCIQNIQGVPNNFCFFLKCAATEKRLGTTGLYEKTKNNEII